MPQEPPILIAKLVLTVQADGTLHVTGNVEDYAYAVAMLEGAKEAVKQHCTTAPKAKVIVPADYTQFQRLT
jgi:hypothetical protein